MKNLILILGLITAAAAGYYFFVQQGGSDDSFAENSVVTANMLASTQVFIQRRAVLESLRVDTAIFNNEKFITLRSFTQPIIDRPIGRTNPFEPPAPPPINTTQ